jgi:hypothetical protein
MVFEVNGAGLDALIKTGLVEDIEEDVPRPPGLNSSVSHIRADSVHVNGFTGKN